MRVDRQFWNMSFNGGYFITIRRDLTHHIAVNHCSVTLYCANRVVAFSFLLTSFSSLSLCSLW